MGALSGMIAHSQSSGPNYLAMVLYLEQHPDLVQEVFVDIIRSMSVDAFAEGDLAGFCCLFGVYTVIDMCLQMNVMTVILTLQNQMPIYVPMVDKFLSRNSLPLHLQAAH